MGKLMTLDAARLAFGELAATCVATTGLEQYKLDRLLELRAVITSMRLERGQELMFDALAKAGRENRS